MTGLVAVAFYTYGASLLLCRVTGVEDIRPVGALLSLLAAGLALLFTFDAEPVQSLVRWIYRQGYLLLLVPLGLVLGRSMLLGGGR